MPFIVAEGLPGQGKSLWTADQTLFLLKRNRAWHRKYPERPIRCVWSNLKLSLEIENEFYEYIRYWGDASNWKYDIEWVANPINVHDADVIWDEISTELPAGGWADTSQNVRRFLGQWRKRGIDIYANTQDYADVDISARRRVTDVYTLTKVFGSRDISATKPPPKYIWGLVIGRDVLNPKELNPLQKEYSFFPAFTMFITRDTVNLYDTTQLIGGSLYPPLKHIERVCADCGKVHIKHE